jgi:hypothetical protein
VSLGESVGDTVYTKALANIEPSLSIGHSHYMQIDPGIDTSDVSTKFCQSILVSEKYPMMLEDEG